MYITGIKTHSCTGKLSHTCTLLRESYYDKPTGKVKNRTLANLTHCDPLSVEAMQFALKHKKDFYEIKAMGKMSIQHQHGLSVGAMWMVYEVAKRIGLEKALGKDRQGQLAMWQVLARVIEQGSCLSSVRLASIHATADIIGIREGFTEDHLYENLAWLCEHQSAIENRLFQISHTKKKPELFLYDVTSSYLEGTCNELGAYGYNRDRKKGKEQLVVGLLCDANGEPVSVEVFPGNTSDVDTVERQIEKATQKYGCEQVTFVGDRGMLKSGQISALKKVGYHYITAITKPQIRKLLQEGVFQLSLFCETVCEIKDNGIRYVLRRNPIRAEEMKESRKQREEVLQQSIQKTNIYLTEHPKANSKLSLEKMKDKAQRLNLDGWITVIAKQRSLSIQKDETALTEIETLDGCYVLKSDVSDVTKTETIHARYKDLTLVEQAFRTLKTTLLEIRPWYVQTEESTRGHALVAMLAFLISRKLTAYWRDFDCTVEEGLKHLGLITSDQLLQNGKPLCQKIALPDERSAALLNAAQITLPEVLPCFNARIVTRKKLPDRRKRL